MLSEKVHVAAINLMLMQSEQGPNSSRKECIGALDRLLTSSCPSNQTLLIVGWLFHF
jgi:hypothetical protein